MSPKIHKILLVEDNPGDVRLIQEMLSSNTDWKYALEDAANLDAAKAILAAASFDAVLLDLGLPDSDGLSTVHAIRNTRPELPVVVLTNGSDREDALKAIQAGAQDYLVKGDFEPELLRRAISYAIERNRLSTDLDDSRREAARQRTLNSLEKLSAPPTTQTTAESFGEYSLRRSDAKVFELLGEEYDALLKGALLRRAYREVPDLESRIMGFAQRLGSLRAMPRDVIELHVRTYRAAAKRANPQKKDSVGAEAQLLLIEVMGYLALYYRAYMGPAPHKRATKESQNSG